MGPLLGDEGSAFWIGREYLRAITKGEDFAPARGIVNSPNAVARIAALAPRVMTRAARGDRKARAIVRSAQRHLADLVSELASALRVKGPIRLSWAGSLMENQQFRIGVWRAARRSGLNVIPVRPGDPPIHAAARLAIELARKSKFRA
jgi:N-acetylglucosamine kinase-like BadF-type ATPase